MKRAHLAAIAITAAGLSLLALAGPLNPPSGPVTSTFKTLTDVEPRIAINATNTPGNAACVYLITSPGSYYLTGNATCPSGMNLIGVKADGVSIDLMGFTITGTAGSGSAVTTTFIGNSSQSHAAVRNGSIVGFGGDFAINLTISSYAEVENVSALWCHGGFSLGANSRAQGCLAAGCVGDGFNSLGGGVVTRCVADADGRGFFCSGAGETYTDCTATNCSTDGFRVFKSVCTGCVADYNTGSGFNGYTGENFLHCSAGYNQGSGFVGLARATLEDCTAVENQLLGIDAGNDATVRNCTATANAQQGIKAGDRCVLIGNQARANGVSGLAGIWCFGNGSQVESNQSIGNGYGIYVGGSQNIVIKNTCGSNTQANYSIFSGNRVGLISVGITNASSITGNTGGGLGFTDPNTNIAY
jgi:parallel beta-helix repeat protein